MKTLLFIIILSAVLAPGAAQVKIDVVAGVGLATFSGGDAGSWGRSFADPKLMVRFHAGLSFNYPVGDQFTFEPGLVCTMKGASYEGITVSYSYEAPYTISSRHTKIELSYLEVPLLFAFKPGKKIHFVAGLKPGIRLSAHERTDAEGSPSSNTKVKDSYKLLEVSGAAGIRYDVADKFAVQLTYEAGLNNIGKTPHRPFLTVNGSPEIHNYYTSNVRNSAFRISIIYKIKR